MRRESKKEERRWGRRLKRLAHWQLELLAHGLLGQGSWSCCWSEERRGGSAAAGISCHPLTLLPPPPPPPRPQQRVLQGEKGREEGSWWRFASHPRHPFTLPPPCQLARQGERWGVAATAKAARASGVLSHGLLLCVRMPLCALAAAACAHVLAFATAAVRTAVRTAAAREGDCYARRRARCCYVLLCVLLCDGARDGLRTAGAYATVNGAFATGRTRDKAMTRDGAANGDADDQRKSRRAGRRGLLPVGRDKEVLAVTPRPPKTARIEKDPAPASIEEDSDESDDADGEASPRRHNPNFTHASCSTLPPLNPTNSTFNRKGVRDQAEVFSAIQAHLRHIDSKLQQGDAEGARTNISQIESLINKRFEVLLVADKAGFEAADCFQLYQSKSVLTSRSYKLAVADVAVSKRARMTYNRPTHGGGLNAGELGKKGSGQGSCQER
ncbi:unnamed protein product [Closterium sp. NIES-53]